MRFKFPLFLLLAGTLAAGIPPRNDVRLYRSTASTDNFDLGVTLLPEIVVKQRLSPEIARRYVVLEVALYPRNHSSIEVNHADFSLRNKGTGQVAYSERLPDSRQRAGAGRNVGIYPEASIGYETGGGYDPATGRRLSVFPDQLEKEGCRLRGRLPRPARRHHAVGRPALNRSILHDLNLAPR